MSPNPRPVAEKGANARLGEAAERRENASPGTALEAECVTGTAADGFAQVKERAAEPAAAAEGDVRAGASTVERMRTLPGAAFSMKNRLGVIFGVSASAPTVGPFMPLILLIFAHND